MKPFTRETWYKIADLFYHSSHPLHAVVYVLRTTCTFARILVNVILIDKFWSDYIQTLHVHWSW